MYMNFGQAVEALKSGKMVKRTGWDSFVFMQVPSAIGKEIIPKMTSLPQSVKDEFAKRFTDTSNKQSPGIYYTDQLAVVDKNNRITGYSPSVSDSLADDWFSL
jgi:hypothetical protein